MNQFNFNSHPELSDQEFATIAIHIFNGKPPNTAMVASAVGTIQRNGGGAAGRYYLLFDPTGGWVAQGYTGNSDDNWFNNIPSWAWLIAIPVAGITAAVLLWRAYGGKFKELTTGNGHGF